MIGLTLKHLIVVVSILTLSSALFAADKPLAKGKTDSSANPPASNNGSASTSSSGSSKSSNILDFDADVIEGERSGPSIMVQMDLQAPNLDTLVFQRKNFNDFHAIDMKRKPKYRDSK